VRGASNHFCLLTTCSLIDVSFPTNPEVTIQVCPFPRYFFDKCTQRITAIIMPDDVAAEKVKALEALGATVEQVRPASIVDKKQVCKPIFL
jgi:hypothetical protein